jgi:Uma2 family endonuclease
MAMTDVKTQQPSATEKLPPLEPGDHLDQRTFHARYKAMPEHVKAELIGGIVYLPAATRPPHVRYQALVDWWLSEYCAGTPETDVFNSATVILADDSEPQPDGALLVLGGQTRVLDDDFLQGPPELLAEIASSSESYDLHSKLADYERWGVQEYLVFVVRRKRVVWFVRERETFLEMRVDADGVFRSRQFPGLWLDPKAFFAVNRTRLREVLHQGLATPDHAAFVERLQKRTQ